MHHVPVGGSKKFFGLLELELQEVVNHTSWVLGTVRVVCVCVHPTVVMGMSEDNLVESFLSTFYVGSED